MTVVRTNIGRRLQILTELLQHEADHGGGVGVVGLARVTGREKSQISRGLKALLEAGLVERDVNSLEFVTGSRLLDLAGRAGQPLLLRRARPVCQRLVSEIGERTYLAVASRQGVLTVETFAAVTAVQAMAWVGQIHPYHRTAAGHALLFDAAEANLRELQGADAETSAGPSDPQPLVEFRERVKRARAAGFATIDRELDADLMTAAAPVRDADGHIIAALTVSGPRGRLKPRLTRVARRLLAAAESISTAMTAT